MQSDEGGWFRYGMHLPANLGNIDAYIHNKLRQHWQQLTSDAAGEEMITSALSSTTTSVVVRTALVVDTTLARNVLVPMEARMAWPRLMRRHTVHFPLTGVGNFTIVNLTMHNPAVVPVMVQLLPLTIYPDPEAFLHYFHEFLPSQVGSSIEYNETLMFTLRDTELFPLRPDSPVPWLREQLEDVLNLTTPRFTLSMILQPNMRVRVRVGFMPRDYELRSSLLILRFT